MFVITQHFKKREDAVFYNFSDSFKSYIQSTYRDTNKLLSTDIEFDSVEKVLVQVNRWASEAEWAAYKQDPQVIAALAEREAYNTANGIEMPFRESHEE